MGGLSAALAALLAVSAAPAATVAPADPGTAQLEVRLPGGGASHLRLEFKKGLMVETHRLPARFLATAGSAEAWVPFQELSPDGKRWALEVLFPQDEWDRAEVRHRVRWPELESVWLMATLFLGHGQNYDRLQAANPALPEKLRKGDLWRIPRSLLAADLGGEGLVRSRVAPPEENLDEDARVQAFRALLTYEQDADGKYAGYRLRKGEALYSSVVLRYTDQVDPKGVTDVALKIARRSGVEDVHSIPPGQLIKIPLSLLADPFQPEGSRALAEERQMQAEVKRTPRVEAGPRLAGIRIVLDAGHGGVDRGAMINGVWESDFVYDITMRVRRQLETDTEAVVSSTIRYPGLGFGVRQAITTPAAAAEILTTPPFPNDGENPNAISVHLRWVLANDLFTLFGRHGDPRKTLFISFHADSLHPLARGTMIYVPGSAGVPASFALGASRSAPVKELAVGGHVAFSPRERVQGEARSRLFAETLLTSLAAEKLPIHGNRPIRNTIQRGGRSFVPAVIRYSNAAAKVLVEVLNLNNDDDAANIQDPAFRERYAEAVVRGIRAYYRK
jgi:N-acetylmuramoyl-L-alanine amidase